jgi:hypothetical protein
MADASPAFGSGSESSSLLPRTGLDVNELGGAEDAASLTRGDPEVLKRASGLRFSHGSETYFELLLDGLQPQQRHSGIGYGDPAVLHTGRQRSVPPAMLIPLSQELGFYCAPFVFVFFVMINGFTLNSLFLMSKKCHADTYPALARKTLGTAGYLVACVLIFFQNWSGMLGGLLLVRSR